MPVKIVDVAELAGVSTATVSRVLAGKPYVSPALRTRVLAAVEELGYRPSRVARSLRARRASIIGLIVSDIQNPFFTALVRGVEDLASRNHYGVFLCNSDEDAGKEGFYIDLMLDEQVAGVILAPTTTSAHLYARLLGQNIPVVAIDRRVADVAMDTVVIDNCLAARQLVERLIAHGHRRIGAILGDPAVSTGRERRSGYLKALEHSGLTVDPALLQAGTPKVPVGQALTQQLLDLPDPPTALFLGNNLLTVGALRAIHDRGLRIPADLELAAFDDMDWMDAFDLSLLVAAQPTYDMGLKAAELLFLRMAQLDRPINQVVLQAEIQVR